MSGTAPDFDLSKALADLAKGEMTALALEKNLDAIEGKVDELLAAFENQDTVTSENPSVNGTGPSQSGTDQNQREEASNSPSK